MSYKRILPAGVLFVLVYFSAINGFAADLKIGVLNSQKVFLSCEAGKIAKVKIEAKAKELQDGFKKEDDALKVLQEEIKKKSSAWSEEKKAEKVRELQKNGRELQAKTEEAKFEMKQMQDKESEPIAKALDKVVEKFAKEKGYSVILDSRAGVSYFDESIEVSDAIIKRLNEAMAGK